MQTVKLDRNQAQELCDEVANMLLNIVEAQNVDDKIDAAMNVFLTKKKLKLDPADLAQRLSWSVKVRYEA